MLGPCRARRDGVARLDHGDTDHVNATTSARAHGATRRKVLVVDDEPSIVDAVATALRYEGYEVEEATTGQRALDAIARFDPDLVVLDIMLPDIDGVEINRRLRQSGSKSAVLFLTARDAIADRVQ